jgi:hypothetical protein
MAKKKAPDADEGATPEPAKKKPAAKKKAPAKKSASKRKKGGETAAPEVGDTTQTSIAATASEPDVIDAEIVSETEAAVAETTEENRVVAAAPTTLTEEERELEQLYGGDLDKPATAHAEYQDQRTRDEDRPMVPEINARDERRSHWQQRRDQRKQRRDERQQRREQGQQGQGSGQGHNQGHNQAHNQGHNQSQGQTQSSHSNQGDRGQSGHGQQARTHEPRPMQPPVAIQPATNGQDADTLGRVGTPLGDAAASVFAQLRNGQPLPVRQLAAMMRKRSLVQQDPEQLWPQLKAELLGDERSYRTLGLRPRIVYRGRDLFAPGPVATSATADAEANVAHALSKLAGATHRAFAARLTRASAQGFERLIHAFLVAAGYREIEWVKRVSGIAYATALAPGLARTVLVSARSGDQPIDRRAVGELRVGVEAKDLVSGILFAPGEVSEDAERELERAGRSIVVTCGEQLVAALVAAGVGVVSAAAPLHYVDDQLLDELLAG